VPKLSTKSFTDTYLRSIKPGSSRTDHYDAIVRGLGLRVATSGTKTWFVMKRIDGSNRRITIGRYPAIPLQDARKKAEALVADIAVGKPLAKAPELTFGAAMEDWFTREQAAKRSATEKRRALAKDVLPAWGKRKLASITKQDVRTLLDSVVDRGAAIHANRLLAALRRFFNWAVERDLIDASPAAGIKPPAKEVSRERSLTRDELAAIWKATETMDYPFGPYIRMLILTGQRRNEVAGAKWNELDLEKGMWTIPGERAKNGKAHLVHLGAEAIATLHAIPRHEGRELVFTTTGTSPISGFSRAKEALDKASGVRDWRIHDLRRTFATLATGDLGIEPAVVDKILNHSSGAVTGIAAVYQRAQYLDKRKEAMEQWGSFVDRPTS
jgi:integrase